MEKLVQEKQSQGERCGKHHAWQREQLYGLSHRAILFCASSAFQSE
jgi:hypothetical protein